MNEAHPTDGELIDAYRRGDATAAERLVSRHFTRLRNLMFQLVLNHHEADELTQEVVCKVLKSLDTFRGDASFSTWLHQIALNTVRHAGRQTRMRHSETIAESDGWAAKTSAPDGELLRHEQQDVIRQALSKLSLPLRSAIVLTVMQGLSAGEAAEVEGCPLGTIYWRVHEARRLLRAELKDWME